VVSVAGVLVVGAGVCGGVEEGRSVVAPAAPLRPSAERYPTHRAKCRAMNGIPGNLTKFEYRFNCRIGLNQFADSTFWLG